MVGGGLSLAVAPAALATELSSSCQSANRAGLDAMYSSTSIGYGFLAGETLTISAAVPKSGPGTEFQVIASGGLVFSQTAQLGETISTTFLADYPNQVVTWEIVATNATWTVSCSNGDEPPADDAPATVAAPIPSATFSLTSTGGGCSPAAGGVLGSWVKLTDPGCAPPSDGAVLLGWATSADFPVDRAKTQVDKGWGPIDEEIGGVRMIFIPINGYTCMTGDNLMYPIWAA